jgi:FKBP-type peptidyl-prolyl cis-trans isomerase SlyD
MLVAQDKVVLIHYTLTNDAGSVLDSSSGGEPLAYIHGQGNLISGLEKALEGKQAGDKLNVQIAPADGYGERDPSLTQRVPMRVFGNASNVKPGMQFQAQSSQGQAQVVTVTSIQGDMVTVDANHPLAGENLHFDVEVTEVREATEEELEHGHVHGPGGHHHHG